MYMYTIDGATAEPMQATSLSRLGILEEKHLEQWVVSHPEVLGDDVKIVATQYNKWSSDFGDLAKERLDILGLDSSGQTVVVELKRESDARIHLQAITYAALVAGFKKETLAEAHAEYLNHLNPGTEPVSATHALGALTEHVEGEWTDDMLTIPKIILLAEDFAAQTYTTVKWLTDLTTNLVIEMHTVNVFVAPGAPARKCAVFRRLYPAADPSVRILTPGVTASADAVAEKIADKKIQSRAARSTYILHDREAIPEGSVLQLNMRGVISPDLVDEVENWVNEHPSRGCAKWVRNRQSPLRWLADDAQERMWTPTALAKHITEQATGVTRDAIPGGDVWYYQGHNLLALAKRAMAESVPTEYS